MDRQDIQDFLETPSCFFFPSILSIHLNQGFFFILPSILSILCIHVNKGFFIILPSILSILCIHVNKGFVSHLSKMTFEKKCLPCCRLGVCEGFKFSNKKEAERWYGAGAC